MPRSSAMYGFHRRGMYEPHSPFGTDMPLDEVLAMLFGGRFPGQPRTFGAPWTALHWHTHTDECVTARRAYQTNTRTQTVHTAELNLMSLLPILLFVIIAMYMLPRHTQPSFSLQPIATYNVPRFTSHLNVPYYVDSSFGSQFEKDPAGLQQVRTRRAVGMHVGTSDARTCMASSRQMSRLSTCEGYFASASKSSR